MKFLVVIVALATVAFAEEEKKTEKRGVLGLGYGGYGLGHGIAAPAISAAPIAIGHSLPLATASYGYSGLSLGHGLGYGGGLALDHGLGYGSGLALGHGLGYGSGLALGHGLGYGGGLSLGHGLGYAAPIVSAPLVTKAAVAAPIVTKTIAAPVVTKTISAAPIAIGHGYGLSGLSGLSLGYSGLGYGKYLH